MAVQPFIPDLQIAGLEVRDSSFQTSAAKLTRMILHQSALGMRAPRHLMESSEVERLHERPARLRHHCAPSEVSTLRLFRPGGAL